MTTACYTLKFADGKRCTAIVMDFESDEKSDKDLKSQFKIGYLIEVRRNEQALEVDRGKSGEV